MKKMLMVLLALSLAAAIGCAKKQTDASETQTDSGKTEEVVVVEEPAPAPVVVVEETEMVSDDMYTVAKGDCLWCIAEMKGVYNDPFMWPLIYKANAADINNPDLIYPGQMFTVPRSGYTLAQLKTYRKSAGAPHKDLAPPRSANLPDYIRADLGY